MYVSRLLKRHFFSLRVSGEDLYYQRDRALPTIVYANHSNWWDGFVMLEFARRRWRIDSHLMMDIEQMRKYRFFRMLGVFSVNRDSPREAVRSIDHAVELLQGTGNLLWIFPQGELLPNDRRPIRFYRGTARIVQKLERVNLLCMALRYEFLTEQRPEIFVRFSHLQRIDGALDPAELTARMGEHMDREVDALRADVTRGQLDDFVPILQGTPSRNSVIDRAIGIRSST